VRNWSNTGRGANYPLLQSRGPHTDEERSAETEPRAVSVPRSFVEARFYWLTKSPVFARRDALRELDEPVASGNPPEPGGRASCDGTILRDEGDFWRVRYEGTWIAVRSVKGLVYLQHLLIHPEEKVHVSQLAALSDQRWSEFVGTGAGEGNFAHQIVRGEADLGAIIDERARREYRVRLADLRTELDEALHWADFERADSIRREIDFLAGQLARAFGRDGRARKTGDPIERVRKAVTNRIHDAVERIVKQHPSLGRHLHNAIRTGFFCWYSPEIPVVWTSHLPPPRGAAR
jgi:hypothetical protein